jgi:hypothetical protein
VTNREEPGVLGITYVENGFRVAVPGVQAQPCDQLIDEQHVGRERLVFASLIRHRALQAIPRLRGLVALVVLTIISGMRAIPIGSIGKRACKWLKHVSRPPGVADLLDDS